MIKVDKLINKCFLSNDYLQSPLQIEICYLLNRGKDVGSWSPDLVRDVLPDTCQQIVDKSQLFLACCSF